MYTCVSSKTRIISCQDLAKQIKFTINIVGNTVKGNKHRESNASVMKAAAYAANIWFQ